MVRSWTGSTHYPEGPLAEAIENESGDAGPLTGPEGPDIFLMRSNGNREADLSQMQYAPISWSGNGCGTSGLRLPLGPRHGFGAEMSDGRIRLAPAPRRVDHRTKTGAAIRILHR